MKIFGVVVLVIAIGVLLNAAAHYISPQDELAQADAIVAVSGGDTKARAETAIRLHNDGWAPRLIFAGAARDPASKSNAQAMAEIAYIHGVDQDAVTIEEHSRNTVENAREVAAIVAAAEYRSIILVTSPYHQRRIQLEFQRFLPEGVAVINYSAPDNFWGPRKWWVTPQGWYLTTTETSKTLWSQLRTQMER